MHSLLKMQLFLLIWRLAMGLQASWSKTVRENILLTVFGKFFIRFLTEFSFFGVHTQPVNYERVVILYDFEVICISNKEVSDSAMRKGVTHGELNSELNLCISSVLPFCFKWVENWSLSNSKLLEKGLWNIALWVFKVLE